MQSHSRRRKAFGLAALSLGTAGAVLGQAADAPGTAKEPRPASHFRLKVNSVEGAMVKNGSLTLKDIKSRQVFSYKAGQRLARQLPPLAARLDDTYTKAQVDAAFLTKAGAGGLLSKDEASQTFLTQSAAAPFLTEAEADALFLTPAEADATYAKKGEIQASPVVGASKLVAYGGQGATILDLPGIGTLRASTGPTANSFIFAPASETPMVVNSSEGGGTSVSSLNVFTQPIATGDVVTLQMVAPAGQVVTLVLSADPGSESPRRMTAQGFVTTP